jgi:NAD(P)-dependent dehydrogenase (short-subunit alcohol dehydrogenase family)
VTIWIFHLGDVAGRNSLVNICFENKVALVTGAASGIGLETARTFAEAGAAVVLADIDEKAAWAAMEDLISGGHKALALHCNVADEAQVAAMVERAISTFGRLDIAFNNAGVQVPIAETADASGEDFDRAIAINLRGIWNCMKWELRQMREQGSGAIVNCSSNSGLVGIPGLGAYTASKHGVIGLTKCAALEYASKGIRINALCPGPTETPMVARVLSTRPERMKEVIHDLPIGRLARSEEIAATVLWLCSPGAGFVIGQALVVDGGYTAR